MNVAIKCVAILDQAVLVPVRPALVTALPVLEADLATRLLVLAQGATTAVDLRVYDADRAGALEIEAYPKVELVLPDPVTKTRLTDHAVQVRDAVRAWLANQAVLHGWTVKRWHEKTYDGL